MARLRHPVPAEPVSRPMNTIRHETAISPITDIIAELKARRMVVLIDEEDRENEGDLLLAAEFAN
ncbi:MAG: 3,4-dihydroxy 2-butanone 4-phosphate synthase / cyclohydrolase, partial [Betaproteobacteria bacterium]